MSVHWQFVRYVLVGLGVNGAFFLLYLLLTHASFTPATAMTLTYVGAMVLGFAFNRRLTFGHDGRTSSAFHRYVATYAIGYVLNLGGLSALVGYFGVPHAVAQGFLVVVLAILFFLMQRFWVFSDATRLNRMMKG